MSTPVPNVPRPRFRATQMLGEIELLLRNQSKFFLDIRQGAAVSRKTGAMLFWSAIFFAVFGAVIGSENSALQAVASAVKLPMLFLMTVLICMPPLFFFNTIYESSLSLAQNFAVVMSGITVTSVVLLAFAPVTVFFLITTSQYQFYKVLNVAIFAIAGFVGAGQLARGMHLATLEDWRGKPQRRRILAFWIVLFGFVGSQLAWTLRPFFGAPGLPFELFRGLGGNFYTDVFASLGEVFGLVTVR